MLNVVVLTGRLVADPELKHTSSDLPVTSFSIAVNRKFVKSGEERQADFIDIVAWRSTAEFICKYFKKGNLIAIEGSIQTRTYQDKDGKNRKVFEVIANNVHFVESKKDSEYNQENYNNYNNNYSNNSQKSPDLSPYSSGDDSDFEAIDSDEDLPF